MNTKEILAKYDLQNVTKFRVKYPSIVKYIRFEGDAKSLKHGKLVTPEDLNPDVLDTLLEAEFLEVHTITEVFWYVFSKPGQDRPEVHPVPMTEESADQLIILGNYEVLSKTPA